MATRLQRAQTQHTHESNKHHTLHSLLELRIIMNCKSPPVWAFQPGFHHNGKSRDDNGIGTHLIGSLGYSDQRQLLCSAMLAVGADSMLLQLTESHWVYNFLCFSHLLAANGGVIALFGPSQRFVCVLFHFILPDSLYIQGEGRSFVVTAFRADLFCPRMHSIEPYKQNPEVVFEQPHHRNVLGIVLEDD